LNQPNQVDPSSNSSATNPARLDSQGLDAGANSDVAGLSLMPIITSSSNQSSYQNASLSETEIVTDLFASSDRNRAAFNLEITELDQSISQAYADYFGELNHQVMSLQQTQTLLQQVQTERGLRSAVIYAMFKEPTVATSAPDESYLELMLVLPSGDSIRKTVNVSRDRVLRQAQLWRMAVPDAADPQSFRPLSQQFYGWLLAPLEAELQQHQITNLMFILDDGLRTLPLAALMDDDGYVVQRYSLAILPSMGLLDQSLHPTFDRSIVAMGADSFVTSDLDSEPLEPLPAVPLELQMVQHKSNRADVLLNETFTVDNFLALQRQQPGIVHLATHAEFQAGQPQASYIQFWDARLGLDQVRSLNWNDGDLDLLILSACTTALGSSEAELGFAGLASAAGVRTVIGSLWQVSDVATLALMSEFYAQLATAPSIAEAMRQAQLSLLQGSVRVENNLLITPSNTVELPRNLAVENPVVLDHPAYWSAFALVGNPW
jgi:CHAT domain-containing protein